MEKVLVLGAGLISKPGVVYLLENNLFVTVASRTLNKAESLVRGYNKGSACQILVEDQDKLETLIQKNDIIVSLLPWIHHSTIAKLCLKNNKHMVTASYVSEEMRSYDQAAKEKGLLFLNEIGIDPGMDHMSAMKIIDETHEQGGMVHHFYSFCGGLPAPEANDNPFGYKFSWSPRGVVLASRNAAKFLEHGEIITIEGKDLFSHYRIEEIEGLGTFEVYPNRDSLPYRDIYGLKDAVTVMRGTYRNIGWCDTLKKIVDLGLVDDTPLENQNGKTFLQMMANTINTNKDKDVYSKIADYIGVPPDHFIMNNLQWLGLFDNRPIPNPVSKLDVLCDLLLQKLTYKPNERDMIILQHTFTIENEDSSKTGITSTLIDYGIPRGDSSMARTVSLPLAVAVRLMSENKIALRGIHIPIKKEIYSPVLKELEKLHITMVEKKFSPCVVKNT